MYYCTADGFMKEIIDHLRGFLAMECKKELNLFLNVNRRTRSNNPWLSRLKTLIMGVLLNHLVGSACIRVKGGEHTKICHILTQNHYKMVCDLKI